MTALVIIPGVALAFAGGYVLARAKWKRHARATFAAFYQELVSVGVKGHKVAEAQNRMLKRGGGR